ncbi:hypothetical protein KAF25_000973 [Fusarium avenaceum]|uniref:Uncharacterized protein n=1 Tax=Fusarium avenaceum TaxID=40199 RepID=A0A9P7HDQ5_9HYPO|nr:hypothetical protein KAF25_000973 [Fusarium avenaceum]
MDSQTEKKSRLPVAKECDATFAGETGSINRGRTGRFIQALSDRFSSKRRSPQSSGQQKEKEGGRRELAAPRPAPGETSPRDHKGRESARRRKKPPSMKTMKGADMLMKSEKIIDKQIDEPTSKASILPQASSSASATAHSSGKPSTFSIDDINTGATILTLITEICNNADGKFSRLEQLDLLDLFKQMPDLMTREQRLSGDSSKMANDFVSTVYQSCGAANWGEIETFDDLKLKLEALTKFGGRAEASPRQEGHIIVL